MISYSKKHQQYGYILEAPRTCVAWTYTEKQELIKQIINGLRLEDIAKQNQRTILAVKYFIITNAFNIINESKITLDTISKLVNMPIDNLKNYIKNQEEIKKKNI